MKLDERGLYPIYDMWHIPFWQTKTFYASVGIVIVLFIGGGIWLAVRRLRRKKLVPLTPWEHALKIFEQLECYPCQSRQDGKEIYSILIRELKYYCELRYQYVCATKTDHEFLLSMHARLPSDVLGTLEDIIQGGILVKFANEQMIQEQLKRHIVAATQVIYMTMPSQQSS